MFFCYLQRMTQKPKLRLFDLTMIVVGLVIGMGIFRTSSDAANAAITPTVFFVAWFAGGMVALCGALTYAEIGSRFPATGGYYKVFAECYHPSIAFAINCIILISNAASMAGVALIGSEYISQVIFKTAPDNMTRALVAMVPIILFLFCEPAWFANELDSPEHSYDHQDRDAGSIDQFHFFYNR